jgi:hypothetical protein
MKLVAEFDKRFTSMNGVDVPEKVSVPRDEWRALRDAIVQSPAQPSPVQDLHFFKQVLSVAIAGLYEHYKGDVLKTFSIRELQEVVDLSESLRPRRVEDIYKQMWVMLATPPAQPEPLPTRVTEEMHVAAVKVLHRANGVPAPVPLTDGVVQKIISKLEPLLDAKNQSWAEAERMLHGITKGGAA